MESSPHEHRKLLRAYGWIEVCGILVMTNEVTELVRARLASEEAVSRLKSSDDQFRVMADETPVIIWVTSAGGDVEFVNRAFCAFFGTSLDAAKQNG